MQISVARNIFPPPPPGNDFDQEHALNNSVARNIFCPLLQGATLTKAKMPTAPACRTPRPDGMVGPLNCNAAHMPDVSRHSGGRCFRGTCGRTPALVIQSVGGRCPGNQKRNAFFMPSLVNSGCRLQSPQQKQGQAPERERERERERLPQAPCGGKDGGCRGRWAAKICLVHCVFAYKRVLGAIFRLPQRVLNIEPPTATFHRPLPMLSSNPTHAATSSAKTSKSHHNLPALG